MKKRVIVITAVTLLLFLVLAWWRGVYAACNLKTAVGRVCDAASFLAIGLLLLSGLTACVNGGAFSMLSYAVRCVIATVKGKRQKRFSDDRSERVTGTGNCIPFLLVGGAYLVCALALLAVYYAV